MLQELGAEVHRAEFRVAFFGPQSPIGDGALGGEGRWWQLAIGLLSPHLESSTLAVPPLFFTHTYHCHSYSISAIYAHSCKGRFYKHGAFLIPEPNSALPRPWAQSGGRNKSQGQLSWNNISSPLSCTIPHPRGVSNVLGVFWRSTATNPCPHGCFCVYQHSFPEALMVQKSLLWYSVLSLK